MDISQRSIFLAQQVESVKIGLKASAEAGVHRARAAGQLHRSRTHPHLRIRCAVLCVCSAAVGQVRLFGTAVASEREALESSPTEEEATTAFDSYEDKQPVRIGERHELAALATTPPTHCLTVTLSESLFVFPDLSSTLHFLFPHF